MNREQLHDESAQLRSRADWLDHKSRQLDDAREKAAALRKQADDLRRHADELDHEARQLLFAEES